MNNILVKLLFKTIIDEANVLFIAKILALSIYADKRINALELNESKKDIEDYIKNNYSMLNGYFQNKIIEYLYIKVLKILEQLKNDNEYATFLEKEIIYELKKMKQRNEDNKLKYIFFYIEDILKSDKIFTKEEQEFFNKLKTSVYQKD